VVFEVVQRLSTEFLGLASFIVVAPVALLPLQADTCNFAVSNFLPVFAGGHDASYEV
jgi:uncharacterized membrane protein